jgi:hypothetical protein
MPSRCITFMLPFDDSNNKEGYNSDFENSFKLEVEDKLDLNKEIIIQILILNPKRELLLLIQKSIL